MYENILCRVIYFFVFGFFIVIYAKSIPTNWINLSADEINGLPFTEIDLNDPSRSNYTVEFVPLISIIADYLPILLHRLRTQEVTTARSLNWLLTDEKICTPHHLGRFPNPDNQCQFFECAMNFKNLINCSQSTQNEGKRETRIAKHLNDVIQLKSEKPTKKKHHSSTTSLAVMYKVNECVSLILHQCSSHHIYSNRLQRCIPHEDVKCPD
ncbi:uncharacterized protein LOC135842552 [Planococcus citri]|uniref:uncharacterized protein LOC135842552 n=1 Tax=Planococcus citri TaxID=170843 RepID=UPI0031F8DEB1